MSITIDYLDIDTLVKQDNEFARVNQCIHGTAYYGYIGRESDAIQQGYSQDEITGATTVTDWDFDQLTDCCG